MSDLRRIVFALTIPAGAMFVAGCGGGTEGGPRLYIVSGTVSFTGEPMKEADLLIRTVDGKHSAGAKVTDGKFQLRAPAGSAIVEITALRDIPGQFQEENPGERVPVKEQFVPSKYNKESTLTMEIKPDSKVVKFDLVP